MIKNLAALPTNANFEYRAHAEEQLRADYESLFRDQPKSICAKNYGEELTRRKSNQRKIEFAKRLHEITGIPREEGIIDAEESIISTIFPRIVTQKKLDVEIGESFSQGKFGKATWEELLTKMRGTYPHLTQIYSYEYCLSQYRALQEIVAEIHEETNEWEKLAGAKKISRIEVRTIIICGKCLGTLKSEVTPEDLEKIVRFVRANYITLDDLYSYCDAQIPPEHFKYFAPDTALSPLKKIWGSLLSEQVALETAKNKLKKVMRIRE